MSKKNNKPEPVMTELTDLVEDVTILDEVEEIPAAPVAPVKEAVYVCVYGDTYPGIAAKFQPAGMTKHQYANELFVINKGKTLSAGVEVIL